MSAVLYRHHTERHDP